MPHPFNSRCLIWAIRPSRIATVTRNPGGRLVSCFGCTSSVLCCLNWFIEKGRWKTLFLKEMISPYFTHVGWCKKPTPSAYVGYNLLIWTSKPIEKQDFFANTKLRIWHHLLTQQTSPDIQQGCALTWLENCASQLTQRVAILRSNVPQEQS